MIKDYIIMKKIFLNLTSLLLLAAVTATSANSQTFQTGNDNFTSLFTNNGSSKIISTTFSTSYLNTHSNMDSFWILVKNSSKPDTGIQLFGDFNSNIITALPYTTTNDYIVGQVRSNTIFDSHYVAPNVPWNTETKGAIIASEWLVANGDINVKDAARSIPFGYVTGKTTGKHIDLDGQSAGTISKTMDTEIGKKYTITFEHTPSPAIDNVVNPNWTEDKPFKVKIGDKEYDFVSSEDKIWTKEAITFTATSDKTDISFISGSQGDTWCSENRRIS
jgi:hypothetical protein